MNKINGETQGTGVPANEWGSGKREEGAIGSTNEEIKKETDDVDWKTAVARDGVNIFTALEKNFSFTATIMSIVGYIIIASFGEMNSYEKYLRYFLFLIIVFLVYKVSKSDLVFNFKKINKSLFILLVIALSLIFFQNFTSIMSSFSKLIGNLK